MRFWRSIGRALRVRCPGCGRGRHFRGFLRMNPACPACGLDFEREHGYYVGAMYVNYGVTVGIGLGVALLAGTDENLIRLSYGLMAFGLVFPVVFFRWSRALWLALQLYVESHTSEPLTSTALSPDAAPPAPPSAAASSASTRAS